jgi:hypothetical protein
VGTLHFHSEELQTAMRSAPSKPDYKRRVRIKLKPDLDVLPPTMSTFDPVSEGILEVLDDLKEDGRRRYIKRRSKDELEEILVVAWRGRDEAKMHSGDLRKIQVN